MHKCEKQHKLEFTETLYSNENTFCMYGVGKVKSEKCKVSMCVIKHHVFHAMKACEEGPVWLHTLVSFTPWPLYPFG